MKKLLTLAGYGLATTLMMTLMFMFSITTAEADDFRDTLTIHIGQSETETYTTNTTTPVVAESQNTSVVAVTQSAVYAADIPIGLVRSEVTYISVTPGAASVSLIADGKNVGTMHVTVEDHKWNTEYTVDKPSTCTTHGVESIHCSVCGAIKPGSERDAELAPHTWATTFTQDVAPTYFEPGSQSIHCTVCGAIDETSVTEIPKLKLGRAKIKSLKNSKPKLTFLKMRKIEGPSGFTVQYGLNKNFSGAKTFYTKNYNVKYKNLKVGKTYYFRVKATLKEDGKKVHGKWSKVKSITIKQ
ncbi:MAG: hypothetical protein J5819_09505 [Eubacterium sp.]|nr:hypothetical protein [Eubacterium sp.]